MRVATKLAKIGGVRGFVAETPVASSATTQQALASSSSSALEEAHLGVAIGKVEQPFHAVPAWDLDDWEFEGEELVADKYSSSSTPRVVFGSVPTIEEAKEATEELKEALDKIYLSSTAKTADGSDDGSSAAAGQEKDVNTKICISPAESTIVPTVPNQALEAFKMLREKPAIQGIVASIASDPNIWNAVMQNKAFLEYCQSGESSVGFEKSPNVMSDESSSSTVESVTITTAPKPKAEKFLEDLIENVKLEVAGIAKNVKVEAPRIANNVKTEVVGIANNVADFFQGLFGAAKKKAAPAAAAEESPNGVFAIGGSIMGLVMMVIMLITMRRA